MTTVRCVHCPIRPLARRETRRARALALDCPTASVTPGGTLPLRVLPGRARARSKSPAGSYGPGPKQHPRLSYRAGTPRAACKSHGPAGAAPLRAGAQHTLHHSLTTFCLTYVTLTTTAFGPEPSTRSPSQAERETRTLCTCFGAGPTTELSGRRVAIVPFDHYFPFDHCFPFDHDPDRCTDICSVDPHLV